MTEPLVIGVDLGTGGVRAIVVTAEGRLVARATAERDASVAAADHRHEQSPTSGG